jgi:hypothetical protein
MPIIIRLTSRMMYISRGSEESATFGTDTKDIWTRFFDNVGNVSKMDDRNIKPRPLVDSATVTNGFSSNR